MTKTVEFRPTIKAVKMNKGGKQEIVLSIENGSLDGKFESINQLIGEAVNVVIQPSVISYRIPYDVENETPYLKYVVDGSGVVVEVKEEQLAIDGINNKSYKDFIVEIDDVDSFIRDTSSLTMPPNVELNPRTILEYLGDGMTYEDIAEEMETKEAAVVIDLDKARQYFAPYAAAWVEYKK
ncbi:hypothetical protein CAT7_05004 [Carnobacterium sp. AT7]|uniref:hypothetical protein n=1 Tax=Carnobacterium sp. AT7 TaxID=333990 RepID=UPI00015F195A|nr:hypothetical protein [Carnobacterium sp. AT7]EDP68597.1 hypothetical protein CAT7_05004 [Carnobacterium sp. AT7]